MSKPINVYCGLFKNGALVFPILNTARINKNGLGTFAQMAGALFAHLPEPPAGHYWAIDYHERPHERHP